MHKRTSEELDRVIEQAKEDVRTGKYKTVKAACEAHRLNISSYYTRSHKKPTKNDFSRKEGVSHKEHFLTLKKEFDKFKRFNVTQLRALLLEDLLQ